MRREEVKKASNIPEGPQLEKRQGRGEEGNGRPGSSQEKCRLKVAYPLMRVTLFRMSLHQSAPTSRRLNVVVQFPHPLTRGGPKWRDNFPEGFDHPVAPNRLERSNILV